MTYNYSMFTEATNQTQVFGEGFFIPGIVIIFSLALITRDWNKWGSLGFPIAIMWGVMGLNAGS